MADTTLDDILAETNAETTADASIVALLDGLQTQLTQALSGQTLTPAAQAKVDKIFATMKANDAAISAAILANTPAGTPPASGGTGITTTAVTSSMNPATVGTSVTLTSSVTQTAPATPAVTPTGTVQFLDGSAPIGTGTLDAIGVGTLAVSTLASGSHSITAVYNGDAANAANAGSTSSALTQVVS